MIFTFCMREILLSSPPRNKTFRPQNGMSPSRSSRSSPAQGDRESVFHSARPDSAGSGGSGIERATALPARAPRPRGGRAGFGRRMSGGKITFPPPVFSARLSSTLAAVFRPGSGGGRLWRGCFLRTMRHY